MKHDTKRITTNTRRRVSGLAALALAGAFASGGWAQSAVEARLQALEARLQTLQNENRQLREELGLDGRAGLTAVKPAGKAPVLTINGLVQAQGEFGDKGDSRGNANDRFRLRRVRLGAAGRFLEEFDFKVEGEYVGSATTLMDGYINWSHFSWANLKAGQFKTPYGYEFLVADPKLYTIERTLVSDRLTLNRQVGVQAAGEFLDKRLGYSVGVFNGSGSNVTTNDNENFNYMGRVAGTAWQGRLAGQSAKVTVGVDGYTSKDTALTMASDFGFTGNSFTGKREGYGVDAQAGVGPVDLWAEYLNVSFRPTSAVSAKEFDADGWYVQATCFVVGRTVQAVAKFDTFDPNDTKVANETDTWTFGTNWFLKGDDLKLQLAYLLTDVPALTPHQRQLFLRLQTIF